MSGAFGRCLKKDLSILFDERSLWQVLKKDLSILFDERSLGRHLKKDLSILFDERGPRSGCSTGMAMPKPKRNLRDRSPKVITTGKLPQQNKPNKPYPILRGRRRISCPFQASHLAVRRGARSLPTWRTAGRGA